MARRIFTRSGKIYESCPSTSTKLSIEDNINDTDDEDDLSAEDATNEDDKDDSITDDECTMKNELQKFEDLKTHCDQNVEKMVLKRSTDCIKVSKFLNTLFSKKTREGPLKKEQRRKIKEIYDKNQEICQKLKEVTKKNRETNKETLGLHVQLEDLMTERKEKWDDAVQVYKLNLGDSSAFVNLDDSEVSETTVKEKEKDCLVKGIDKEVCTKSFRTVQIARVLYNLICISDVSWSTNENLLAILDCTSKLFDKDFDLRKPREFTEIIDEVTSRLNKVKI